MALPTAADACEAAPLLAPAPAAGGGGGGGALTGGALGGGELGGGVAAPLGWLEAPRDEELGVSLAGPDIGRSLL
jgi:hypothetical protein